MSTPEGDRPRPTPASTPLPGDPVPDTATRLLPRQPMADAAVIKAIVLTAVALTAALVVGWLGLRRVLSRIRRNSTAD